MTFFGWGPEAGSWSSRLLDFFFPRYCFACGRLLPLDEALFCKACGRLLPRPPNPWSTDKVPGLTRLYAPFLYEGPVRETILAFKYEKRVGLLADLARFLRPFFPEVLFEVDLVVSPVPLHAKRLWWRGFNQSELLARAIFGPKKVRRLLLRRKDTRPQARLSARERARNVRGAFKTREGGLSGKKVLLFDDVFTTGATAGECARTLLSAGVGEVWLAVVARAG